MRVLVIRHGRTATHHSGSPGVQPLGRGPNAGRLCSSFHGKERPTLFLYADFSHGDRRYLFSSAGSDRRHDYPLLRHHQCLLRHHRRRRRHAGGRPSDQPLCDPPRGRHRPADPWRKLRLYWLDGDIAHLCELHLYAVRDRSVDHDRRTAARLRHPALDRLHHQRRRGDPSGHLRRAADLAIPIGDPTLLDRAQHPAFRLHRLP